MGINTLNESELHRILKSLYRENNEGSKLEVEYGPYIVDIQTAEGNVIEIQTQSLSHLAEKVHYFIGKKKKITVVFPLITNKKIEIKLLDGTIKLTRSPIHKNIYTSFRELTKLTPYLLSPYFFLDTVEVTVIEERQQTKEKVQSRNGRRRFRQNWLKTGKRVAEIGSITRYHGRRSWKALLPKGIPEAFYRADFYKLLKESGIQLSADDASLMLWVYAGMGLIERTAEGRKYRYRIKSR
ncbi:MAG: hypothetical protein J6Y13_06510 [Treponema sp.]|nr:hypothetical protein [Treponema sp.]